MKKNSPINMRELTGNETASVAGGVLGAIPGYSAPLPSGLFVSGYRYTTFPGVPGGIVKNDYTGDSGWTY
jgi:hypothetical protein